MYAFCSFIHSIFLNTYFVLGMEDRAESQDIPVINQLRNRMVHRSRAWAVKPRCSPTDSSCVTLEKTSHSTSLNLSFITGKTGRRFEKNTRVTDHEIKGVHV